MKGGRPPKYVLFERLNVATLPVAYCLMKFGYAVYFLHLAAWAKHDKMLNRLRRLGLQPLSYEMVPERAEYEFYTEVTACSQAIFDDLCAGSTLQQVLEAHFQLEGRQRRAFHLAQVDAIRQRLMDFVELIPFADRLAPEARSVSLFATNNALTRHVLKRRPQYRNLCWQWLQALAGLVVFTKRCVQRLCQSMRRRRRPKTVETAAATSIDTPPPAPETFEVLFFPHQGIMYGDLFKKDHFYSDNPTSPFSPQKILHISLADTPSELAPSIAYYEQHGIPYMDFNQLSYRGLNASLRDFVGLLRRSGGTLGELRRFGTTRMAFYFYCFRQMEFMLSAMANFGKARVALIGYDILFPPFLSIALSMSGITTIACQERFFCTWYDFNKVVLDHYFVCGEVVKEWIDSRPQTYCVEQVHVTGPIRLDLIHEESRHLPDDKYTAIKKDYLLVLAMDYQTSLTEHENYRAMTNHWGCIRRFYEDLVQLCHDIPGLYVVIKSKNADNAVNPQFQDIHDRIEATPNLSFETDLATYTPSRMIAIADGAIALQTSMADEMLAAGKPVWFYDFFGLPTPYFDYETFPVIVRDYDELADRMRRLVTDGQFVDEDVFASYRKRFYGDSYDGKIRARLHPKLESIYRNVTDKT